jgi:hypothetical protein
MICHSFYEKHVAEARFQICISAVDLFCPNQPFSAPGQNIKNFALFQYIYFISYKYAAAVYVYNKVVVLLFLEANMIIILYQSTESTELLLQLVCSLFKLRAMQLGMLLFILIEKDAGTQVSTRRQEACKKND